MAKIKQIFLLTNLIIPVLIYSQIVAGANQLELYLPLLKSKNVAIVGNQTSVIQDCHLVDTLLARDVRVKKVFSPEHGFRGNQDAGKIIQSEIDHKTQLPIISLYGSNKKPQKKDLQNIDIILFDIQDVGVRFYTYISTLHYVMQASAENDIHCIVLDRPNPNAHYIDGPILEKEYSSFVGMHPVPIVYGMTIGEYAKMINGEKWIEKKCKLTVIPIKNYHHIDHYNLPINPSPNLRNSRSINLYPSLCLFEGTNISVGRGTEYPFQHFGAPYLKSTYSFTPISSYGSKNPKYQDIECFGTDLRYQDDYLYSINLDWIIEAYKQSPDQKEFFNNFFDKLAGNKRLREQIISGLDSKQIKESWKKDIDNFLEIRNKYLLY